MSQISRPTSLADVRAHLERAIGIVAPDVVDEVASLDADVDFFEEFGLDSMDRLTIMETVVASTGVAIPDDVVPRLTNLRAFADHLTST
jgi:acyl carrier protein